MLKLAPGMGEKLASDSSYSGSKICGRFFPEIYCKPMTETNAEPGFAQRLNTMKTGEVDLTCSLVLIRKGDYRYSPATGPTSFKYAQEDIAVNGGVTAL